MTKREWLGIAAAITALWPNADLAEPTVAAWYEVLRDAEAEPIRKAVMDLHVEGRQFPPTAGELYQHSKKAGGPYTGPSCTCHLGGLDACRSTAHPEEFLERQRVRDQAASIVESAAFEGGFIDPNAYPGHLGEAIRARMLGAWYDQNAAAGRAIADPGDAEGLPTKPAPRHRDRTKGSVSRLGDILPSRQAITEKDASRVLGALGYRQAVEETTDDEGEVDKDE